MSELVWAFPRDPLVDFSLVIPLYNEEESVTKTVTDLVECLRSDGFPFEIVAVNNGSSDGTAGLLDELSNTFPEVRRVDVPRNQGYGWGVLSGLIVCEGEHVGFMGGDGQVAPDDVLQTYRLYRETGCDLAKVRRITRGDGPVRAFISWVYNRIFTLATGFQVSDANASPKILRRDRLPILNLGSRDWFLDAELMIKAHHDDWRIEEHPMEFLPREAGHSWVRAATLWEFLKNLRTWSSWLRRERRKRS